MFETKISQKHKVILFTLLIILNIVLRIPSIPHEKGADSFAVHALANSITTFGQAKWWINWLSVFGLYPYSSASAVPFSLSGIAQLTGLTGLMMEKTILLYSIVLGLFSIFTAYTLAGVVYRDFLFKYLMALFFSAAQGTMTFSTWEISTRGPFLIFLPLFLFILLKKIGYVRKAILLFALALFLYATHHYAHFLIPLTLLYITLKILSIFKLNLDKNRYININYLYLISVVFAFILPFFTRAIMAGGSRYAWVMDIITVNTRYVGPIIFFVAGGLIYAALKADKKIEEWYFLGVFMALIPFSYNLVYGQYILVLFLVFLITIAFRNLLNIKSKNKIISFFIVFSLILFVSFSAFYNHERTGSSRSVWYMDEKVYTAGQWIDAHINKEKRVMANTGGFYKLRLMALQNDRLPILQEGVLGLVYEYVNESFINANLQKVPMTSSYFYFEGAYKITEGDPYRGSTMRWFFQNKDIGRIKKRYNMDFLIQSPYAFQPIGLTDVNSEVVYTNGIVKVYDMRFI